MNIDEILDLLDDALEDAWTLPLSGGRRVVDIEKIRELTDDIRLNPPTEIRQAKAIVSDRADIVATAKKEAAAIIKRAEDKARSIVAQDDLVKAAQKKAGEILSQAQMQAREMKQASTEFADNVMKSTEQFLIAQMDEVKSARARLHGREVKKL